MPNERLRISATINRAQEEDRKELETFFKDHSVYPISQGSELDAAFKRAHKAVYGLCIWPQEFAKSPIHQRVFLEELRSDVLQSIQMALVGFRKPVALLLRSAIEDILRHLYYFDHHIEFEKLELSSSCYEKIGDLWQYAKKHPRLAKVFAESNAIELLENEYAVFSRFVHSSSTDYMNLTKSLSEIGFEMDFFKEYANKVSALAGNIHFVLFAFYEKALVRFNPPWKSFLLDIIPETCLKSLLKNT